MAKRIIIDASYQEEIRVALLNSNNQIEALEYEIDNKEQIKGNIYLAKIVRIEPSLQAAFIEYGPQKNGFLPFSEIHPDYYHIPVSDREDKDQIVTLHSITPPNITSADLAEQESIVQDNNTSDDYNSDEKSINLDAGDLEVDTNNNANADKFRNYKIQDVIKKGQIVLVQAQKEERGNKGASFSSYLSLAGKYCVLMPNRPDQNGISKKIATLSERKRLRDIVSELTSGDSNVASVIVRTAGVGKTTYELKRDYDYLARLWNKIREATMQSRAPAFIHMEDGIIQKTVRNMLDHSVKEVIVQGKQAYNSAIEFIRNIVPSDESKVQEYTSKTPIFTKYDIETQLSSLYQPNANLPSGGYIVINPTEALISIDVNSGKSTGERNIEETALRTNLEAAAEIARQIRLRDLSGLIVIDFIDMYEQKNRRLVERALRQHLSSDRARIQTSDISMFGLLEMSRQRLKPSFLETHSKMCNHCRGKGVVRVEVTNSMLILRTIENEIFKNRADIVNIYAHPDVVSYLLNYRRKEISSIESKYRLQLCFINDLNATSDSFSIEKIRNSIHNNDVTNIKQAAVNNSSSDSYAAHNPQPHSQKENKQHKPHVKQPTSPVTAVTAVTAEASLIVENTVVETVIDNIAPTINTIEADNTDTSAPKKSMRRNNRRPTNKQRPRKKIGESENTTPTSNSEDSSNNE